MSFRVGQKGGIDDMVQMYCRWNNLLVTILDKLLLFLKHLEKNKEYRIWLKPTDYC